LRKTEIEVAIKDILNFVKQEENSLYSFIVLFSGFVWGVSLFLIIIKHNLLSFSYCPNNMGIISWVTENQYPYQKEQIYFLIGFSLPAFFSLFFWLCWLMCGVLVEHFNSREIRIHFMKKDALSCLSTFFLLYSVLSLAGKKVYIISGMLFVVLKIFIYLWIKTTEKGKK
jgi:hypothetical protein